MAIINTTPFNVEFHEKHSRNGEKGLRVPTDDNGVRSLGDRPFAMGSYDQEWELGSANRAVKHVHEYRSGVVDLQDQANYYNGMMGISQLSKYAKKELLWGFKGDARYKKPVDLMSFRGYPTPELVSIEYHTVELNQVTETNIPVVDEIISTSISSEGQTIETSLPINSGYDFVTWSGAVTLNTEYPMDYVYIYLAQESEIQDFDDSFKKLYSGRVIDRDFSERIKCYNSGDDIHFNFRMSGETDEAILNDGDFRERDIDIKMPNYYLSKFTEVDYPVYGYPTLATSLLTRIYASWNGSQWVGIGQVGSDIEAPTTPQNLVVTSQVGNEIQMDWDASTDNVGVHGYMFYYREYGTGRTFDSILVPLNSYTFIGNGRTSYEFYVTAIDFAGNESEDSNLVEYETIFVDLQVCYVGGTSYTNPTDACNGVTPSDTVYSENPQGLLDGSELGKLYTDPDGLIPFVGLYKNWKFAKTKTDYPSSILFVRDTGDVVGYNSC